VRFVFAPSSANVENDGVVPQRLHEPVERAPCIDIEVDVGIVSGLRFQASRRSLRHMVS
jgi:hypothetical protein